MSLSGQYIFIKSLLSHYSFIGSLYLSGHYLFIVSLYLYRVTIYRVIIYSLGHILSTYSHGGVIGWAEPELKPAVVVGADIDVYVYHRSFFVSVHNHAVCVDV